MPVTNAASGIKAGTVAYFAASSAPAGWIKANGALVSRATYAALFAAIGTTYGAGDGSTTFAVPDLRGEFLRGWDDSRGVDAGRAIGTAQTQTRIRNYAGGNGALFFQETDSADSISGEYASVGGVATSATLYGMRPRNVALLACIKF